MKRLLCISILSVLALATIIIGPFSPMVSAIVQSGGGGGGGGGGAGNTPLLQISFNWVNQCDISGTVLDSVGSTSSSENLSLVDPGCVQDFGQNGNNTGTYQFLDGSTCQQSDVWAASADPSEKIVKGYIYYVTPGVGGACDEDTFSSSNSISIQSTGNSNIIYAQSGNTISRTDGNTAYVFTQSSSNNNIYVMDNGLSSCPDRIVVNGSSADLWELSTGPSNGDSNNSSNTEAPASIGTTGCYVSYYDDDVNGPKTNNEYAPSGGSCETDNSGSDLGLLCSDHSQNSDGSFTLNLGNASNATPASGGGSGSSGPPSCEETGGGLAWFTCLVIDGISTLENSLEGVVEKALVTQPIDLNTSDCNTGPNAQNYTACIYNVWSQFRVFGDILLVIVLLVVIIAEIIGGGTIEAYSVRKILPRILLTAILINLSIYIVAGLFDITNIVGGGIFNLITIPFKASGTYHINISGSGGTLFGGGLLLGTIGAGGALWALHSIGGLGDALSMLALFVGLPALLAILGVLLTIFFRQILIILLLIVSPVAFALYCLPNTEQYFRKWWDLLFKTLMVYPIVMVIFAMCDVGAVVVSSFIPSGEQWIGDLMAILAVSAPLFLIPFAFKFSGGVVGSVYGGIHDLSNKFNEAVKGNPNDPNSLRNRTKRRFGVRRSAAGLSWGAIGTRINPRQVTATGRRNAKARLSAHRQAGLEQLRRQEEETGIFKASQGDSNILRELAMYHDGREARGAADNWRAGQLAGINTRLAAGTVNADQARTETAEVDRRYHNRQAAIAVAERIGYNPASRRAALLNQYQIGFEMEAGEAGWDEAKAAARDISGGDPFQYRSIMDEFQAVAKGPAGRVDLAGNTDGNDTYNGPKAWSNGGLHEIGQGKPRAVQGSEQYFLGLSQRIATNTLDARDQDFVNEAQERGISDPRVVATEALGVFYSEQAQLAQTAKGGVRDAAIAAKRRIGESITANEYITGTATTQGVLSTMLPLGQTKTPATAADALASTQAVRDKARTYETAEQIAARGGTPTGGPAGGP